MRGIKNVGAVAMLENDRSEEDSSAVMVLAVPKVLIDDPSVIYARILNEQIPHGEGSALEQASTSLVAAILDTTLRQ
jgi:hypothetical protein